MEKNKRYSVLIVEDKPCYSEPLKLCFNQSDDFVTMGVTDSESEALKLVKAGLPDAVIVDLQLTDGEGDGIQLLQQIRDLEGLIPISPYLLVLTHVKSERTWERLNDGLTDISFSKDAKGYSPELILKHLRTMSSVFDRNRAAKPQQDDSELSKEAFIRKRIMRELDLYYIAPGNDIKDVLAEGIYLIVTMPEYEKPVIKEILMTAGKKYNKDWRNVHARIDNLIHKAFAETAMDDLQKAYTPYQSISRGAPTTKDFVTYIAAKIRAEDIV